MYRIGTSLSNQTKIEEGWLKSNDDQITKHPAWIENITESKANRLLERQAPFIYLLRRGEKGHAYSISFVKEDGSIKHQSFTLEFDKDGWYYENGITDGPAEVVAKDIQALIPLMMHCDSVDCIPLTCNLPGS